jgi:hypothetical protein
VAQNAAADEPSATQIRASKETLARLATER